MSAIDQLLTYIKQLTPENEKEEYVSAITTALCKTNDIALLDLILQLLQKSRKA